MHQIVNEVVRGMQGVFQNYSRNCIHYLKKFGTDNMLIRGFFSAQEQEKLMFSYRRQYGIPVAEMHLTFCWYSKRRVLVEAGMNHRRVKHD